MDRNSEEPMSTAVVMVNWNCDEDVVECIRRLPAAQVIVVDNGSTNAREAEVSIRRTGADFVGSPINLGFGGGMNIGMRRARALGFSHALLLNPDTFPSPTFVDDLSLEIGDAAVLGVEQHRATSDGADMGAYPSAARMHGARLDILSLGEGETIDVDIVTGAAILISLEWAERVGYIDERFFHYKEEFDLVYRIGALGGVVRSTSKFVLLHRSGGSLAKTSLAAEYFRARNEVLFLRWRMGAFSLLTVPGFWFDCVRRATRSMGAARAVTRGLWDGICGRYGPLAHPLH